MLILVADDDPISRRLLSGNLVRWNYTVEEAEDGNAAWAALTRIGGPQLAILDWTMPGLSGVEICRELRRRPADAARYLLLLTARGEVSDIVEGLENGASDFLSKPFQTDELRARLAVGVRVLELQNKLAQQVAELQQALDEVKQLRRIVPICCYCKNVRTDKRFWQRVEDYLVGHNQVDVSHGICPDCWERVIQPQMRELWGHEVPYEDGESDQPGPVPETV